MVGTLEQGLLLGSAAQEPRPRAYALRVALVSATVMVTFLTVLALLTLAQWLGLSVEQLHGSTLQITPATVTLFCGYFALQLALIGGVHRFVHRQPLARLRLGGKVLSHFGLGFLLGLVVSGLEQGWDNLFARGISVSWAVPPDVSTATLLGYYTFWFVVILTLNSLSEELTFRVYPIEQLADREHGPALVVVLTSVAFSLIHHLLEPFSWEAFVARASFALLAGFLYQRFRSLWLVCGVHNAANFLGLTFSGNWKIGGLWKLSSEPGSDLSSVIGRILVIALAIFLLWRFTRQTVVQGAGR